MPVDEAAFSGVGGQLALLKASSIEGIWPRRQLMRVIDPFFANG